MPLPNISDSSPSQVLVLTTDLTEKHLAEQRERELALSKEKNAFLTDFFSTLSHDLKTPLSVMNTSLYLLQRAETAGQRTERIARLSEQVALMDKYIQDMLIISRLEHVPPLEFQAVHLNMLIQEVTHFLRPRIEGKQLKYQFAGQPDLPAISGEPEQLQRMLVNLVENAVNYTAPGGQVTIKTYTTDASDGLVMLEVTDSGIGIEPDAVPHIFERFFRTSKAKMFESKGTVLGLAIVKKIADMHKATIEVRSQPNEGTTFSIQFPITFPDGHVK